MNSNKITLENWTFKLTATNEAKAPAQIKFGKKYPAIVPGTIHTDLLANKLIEEPFYADNELQLQWISDCDWEYETVIHMPKKYTAANPVHIVFEGLDTVADVYVNNTLAGNACNMFRTYRFDIGSLLKGGKNTIRVHFSSPVRYAKAEESLHGKLPVALRPERVYIRKAQYSFGWDWGPEFITSGMWRKVYIENITSALIDSVHCDTKSASAAGAEVNLRVRFSQQPDKDYSLQVRMSYKGKTVYTNTHDVNDLLSFDSLIVVEKPLLWNPAGSGEQHLYDIEVILLKNGNAVDICRKRIGIRIIKLELMDVDQKTFRFVVNGKPVYIKGANWIPSHSFLPEVKEKTYRKLITLAKDANMNMLRVWGGGTYEDDIFYDICDELGLLVWQDFMFACGAYPEHEEFLNNVAEEVKQNVSRLSPHPSLAIWCGNNENEWIWYQEQRQSFTKMPGHTIYKTLIPEIVAQLDPLRPYWVSSPFGDDEDPNAMTSGNRHQWIIWSMWTDYSKVVYDTSLFVTEFGFQGPANRKTLEYSIPKKERSIQSRLFEFHNKQIEGNERVIRFLAGHLPLQTSWKDFLYLAQLNQGFALQTCLEHWRFSSGQTNGSIIWQLNDCWPVTSWSLIDSKKTPKLAYHFVKNTFAPVALSFRKNGEEYSLMCINDTDKSKRVKLELSVVHAESGKVKSVIKTTKTIKANTCDSIYQLNIKESSTNLVIHVATIYDEDKNLIHRTYMTQQPWKYIKLPPAKIKMSIRKRDKEHYVSLKAGNPAFFVDLSADACEFSQRGMILLPGEQFEISLQSSNKGAPGKKDITIHTLNDFLQ
jgi:beta-mannosidase